MRMFVQYSATAQGAAFRVRQACLAVGLQLKHLKTPQGPEGLKLETLRVGKRVRLLYHKEWPLLQQWPPRNC